MASRDKQPAYRYKAEVLKVVDADTLDLKIYLGFHVTVEERFRLFGINAWETKGPEKPQGLIAKARVEALLPVGTEVLLDSSRGQGKYGRWLALIWFKETDTESLNDLLVVEGHARYQEY